jgi:hypothetical protein
MQVGAVVSSAVMHQSASGGRLARVSGEGGIAQAEQPFKCQFGQVNLAAVLPPGDEHLPDLPGAHRARRLGEHAENAGMIQPF